VAASDLSPVPDMMFRRMAILLSEPAQDGRVLVRGVTDRGMGPLRRDARRSLRRDRALRVLGARGMVDAMRRVKRPAAKRRPLDGAAASKRLLRWAARNYFAEIEPRLKEGHPIDDLMAADPGLRRLRRQARRRLDRLQALADQDALLAPLNWKKTLEDKDAQQRLDANVFRRATLGSLDNHRSTKQHRQARP